jgi:tRNA threonylcarbamoyladenosine biosynthesis protein TsaB
VAFILNIETATTVCSVSVSDKDEVITFEEVNGGYTHAENLHVFIKEVMQQAGLEFKQLDAIAVSKGPGSYTGLRIGVSAAKGLAYALNVPLISIDTLQLMAKSAEQKIKKDIFYFPMLDARRMEVYCAVYNKHMETIVPVNAFIVNEESIGSLKADKPIVFFGDGMPKCRSLLETLNGAEFLEDIVPTSEIMPCLSYKKYLDRQFENTAYFEPYYLKEFLITSKKNTLLGDPDCCSLPCFFLFLVSPRSSGERSWMLIQSSLFLLPLL